MRAIILVSLALIGYIAPSDAVAGQIKIVIATDENEREVGADMRISSSTILGAFVRNVPRNFLEVHKVGPERFTAQAILAEIEDLNVAQDDAIFFFYGGHGAYDPQRKTFVMASADGGQSVLFASQIREAIEAKRARLGVIVLDCCKTLRPINATIQYPDIVERRGPEEVTPLFNSLFFQVTGTVVIESSAPGEYALILPQHQQVQGQRVAKRNQGSFFVSCLGQVLKDPQLTLRPLRWSEVCRATQAKMDDGFQEICPGGRIAPLGSGEIVDQNSQNITAWINGNAVAFK